MQILGFTIGFLLLILGAAQIIPAGLDHIDGHTNAHIFFYGSLICFFFGGLLYFSCRGTLRKLNLRGAFLMTAASWLVMCLFAALPLFFSDLELSFTKAFFESVSGLTTTGSTILSGLDTMSRGILAWRAIMNWIGGMGFVAFAIVLLPLLRVGGMQLFRMESSDKSEKSLPRTGDIVKALLKVYIGLTLLCALTYYMMGMTSFDAVTHAAASIATGGFSTHDASFGFFENPALHYAATVFMLLGGLPFVLFISFIYRGSFDFHRDEQVRALMAILAGSIAAVTIWLAITADKSLEESFRLAAFNIVSIVTTTGFATADYSHWGAFPVIVFFFLTYLGACAGSTSGGIKMVRIVVALRAVVRQVRVLLHPRGIFAMTYQDRPLPDRVVQEVLTFLCLYVLLNALLTLALAFTGLDFVTALTGAATALANVGPGLGPVIGPAGNFSTLPDSALWLLSAGMLLGRLEILTVFVLFMPRFWRD